MACWEHRASALPFSPFRHDGQCGCPAVGRGLLMVKPDEVFCCTFDEDTRLWHLRLANGQIHKLKKQTTAKAVLSLSPSLAQVRQDCIINLDYLISIENYTLRCIFSPPFDQENITVSRRCYKAVKEKLEIL